MPEQLGNESQKNAKIGTSILSAIDTTTDVEHHEGLPKRLSRGICLELIAGERRLVVGSQMQIFETWRFR